MISDSTWLRHGMLKNIAQPSQMQILWIRNFFPQRSLKDYWWLKSLFMRFGDTIRGEENKAARTAAVLEIHYAQGAISLELGNHCVTTQSRRENLYLQVSDSM